MTREPLTIMQHWHQHTETMTYTVESWPRETMFDEQVLKNAQDDLLTVDGDEVTITVENGQAVYRLDRDDYDVLYMAIPAYLVSSRLST